MNRVCSVIGAGVLHVWLIFKGPLQRYALIGRKSRWLGRRRRLHSTSADDDDAANRPRIKLLLAAIQMGTQFYSAGQYH
jgi:hypothetical protein